MTDEHLVRVIKAVVEQHHGSIELSPSYIYEGDTASTVAGIRAMVEIGNVTIIGTGNTVAETLRNVERQLVDASNVLGYARLAPDAA